MKDKNKRILLTCNQAIKYIKHFVSGDIIIEYKVQNGKIIQMLQYHKDEPISAFSFILNTDVGKEKINENTLLVKARNILIQLEKGNSVFSKEVFNDTKIIIKKVNWLGEVVD